MSTLKKLEDKTILGLKERVSINDTSFCVSELVKNSIDAGSTSITVQINLAKNWLEVADNGLGISKKNIKTIGDRYFTNKSAFEVNKEENDKMYYGQRGEFLSRIIDLCEEVVIESLPKPNQNAYIKIFKNGSIYFLDNSAKKLYITRTCQGTTITLSNIFYNKSKEKVTYSTYDQIKHVIEILSLINHKITFTLRDTTKPLLAFTTKGMDKLSEKFKFLFNLKMCNIHYVSCKKSNITVETYLCAKLNLKNNLQFIYINKLQATNNNSLHNFINNEILLHIDKFDVKQLKNKASIALSKTYRRHPIYVINIMCLDIYNDNIVKNCIKKCIHTFAENYLNQNTAILLNDNVSGMERNVIENLLYEEKEDLTNFNNDILTKSNDHLQNKNNNELKIDLQKLFIDTNEMENTSNRFKSINLCLLWLNKIPKYQRPYVEDNFPNDLNKSEHLNHYSNTEKFTNEEDITMFLNKIPCNKILNKTTHKKEINNILLDKKLLWSRILKSNKKFSSFSNDEKSKLCKRLQKKIEHNLYPKEKKNVKNKRHQQSTSNKMNKSIPNIFNRRDKKIFNIDEEEDIVEPKMDNINSIKEFKDLSTQYKDEEKQIDLDLSSVYFSNDDAFQQNNFFESNKDNKKSEKKNYFSQKLNDQSMVYKSDRQDKSFKLFDCEDIKQKSRKRHCVEPKQKINRQSPSDLKLYKELNKSRTLFNDKNETFMDQYHKEKPLFDQHHVCKNIDCNHLMSHQCNFIKKTDNPNLNYIHHPIKNNIMAHHFHLDTTYNPLISRSNNNYQQINECKMNCHQNHLMNCTNHHCSSSSNSNHNDMFYNNQIIEKQIEFDINLLNKIKNQSKLHDLSTSTMKHQQNNHCCQCCCKN